MCRVQVSFAGTRPKRGAEGEFGRFDYSLPQSFRTGWAGRNDTPPGAPPFEYLNVREIGLAYGVSPLLLDVPRKIEIMVWVDGRHVGTIVAPEFIIVRETPARKTSFGEPALTIVRAADYGARNVAGRIAHQLGLVRVDDETPKPADR